MKLNLTMEHLEKVVKTAQNREREGSRIPPKVDQRNYIHQDGMTCVMNPTKKTIREFGESLYKLVSQDPQISKVFLPLPPDAYHVTLLGLEYSRLVSTAKQTNKEIFKKFEYAQNKLNQMVSPSKTIQFTPWIDTEDNRMGLKMRPSIATATLLRRAETFLKKTLMVYRKRSQDWHMTLGYFKPKIIRHERHTAERRIMEHVKKLMSPLTFLNPQICLYTAHTKYEPLFICPGISEQETLKKELTKEKPQRKPLKKKEELPFLGKPIVPTLNPNNVWAKRSLVDIIQNK